jgi:hypothetical protein
MAAGVVKSPPTRFHAGAHRVERIGLERQPTKSTHPPKSDVSKSKELRASGDRPGGVGQKIALTATIVV